MKQIQKLTVRNPRTVQIAFLLILILPLLVMYGIGKASASNLEYCNKQFSNQWFQEVSPELRKECGNRFIWNTNRIKSQFRNFK